MNLMLLAAGEGTRLRPYTQTCPKPAMPFLNIPLAAHVLGFVSPLHVTRFVVNTFYLPQKIHNLFESLPTPVPPKFNDESVLLGSGGGLKAAQKYFDLSEPIVLMNADEVILPADLEIISKALDHHRKTNALSTLIVMKHPEAGKKFGGVWTKGNRILGFGKDSIENTDSVWHFIGVQILSPRIFNYLPEGESNILYDAVVAGINNNELAEVYPIDCEWFETGNPQDYMEAQETCLRFLANEEISYQKKSLQRSLDLFAAEKQLISTSSDLVLMKSASATIEGHLSGFAVIGAQSVVPKNFSGKNIVVAAKTKIAEEDSATDKVYL